jgi:hypothetical protein
MTTPIRNPYHPHLPAPIDALAKLAAFDAEFGALDRADKTWSLLPIGSRPSGTVAWDLRRSAHAAFIGAAGTGKTVAASLAIHTACRYGFEVSLFDPTGDGFEAWEAGTHIYDRPTDINACRSSMIHLAEAMQARLARLADVGALHWSQFPQSPAPILAVVEDPMGWLEGESLEAYRRILFLGRAPGVHLLVVVRDSKSADFGGGAAFNNIGCRLLLGTPRPGELDRVFHDVPDLDDISVLDAVGCGMFTTDRNVAPQTMRCWFASEYDLIGSVSLLSV